MDIGTTVTGDAVNDYDQIALEYARHRQLHPEVLRDLLAESGIDGHSSLLEVGCGSGARPETSRGHTQFSIQSIAGASLRIQRLRSGDGASIPALLR